MTRERLFQWSWRLMLLTLPWQTRWFHEASLAGWPWEQGRWSVYVSWLLIVLTVVLGWPRCRSRLSGIRMRHVAYLLAALFVCSFVPILWHSDQPARFVAVSQWWIEVLFLLSFGLTLSGAKVAWRSIAWWFVISLIPQAILGLVQYGTQVVVGSKWLGIAPHLAETPGTAVVEFELWRYLRAYGGFPHPNILGGWLAVGLLATLLLAGTSETKKQALLSSVLSALFAVVLVLTFSRSAWVACAVGFVALLLVARKQISSSQYFWLAVASAVLVGGAVGVSQRAVVLARSDVASRLEAKSIDTRRQSLVDGLTEFRAHPLFGSGPNAELIDLPHGPKTVAPLEPPHNVFLVALTDLGVVGVFLLAAIAFLVLQRMPRRAWPFVICLCIVGLFDHYPWSAWSGMSLAMIIGILAA